MHELPPLVTNEGRDDHNSAHNTPMTVAELEFVTFTRAVTELFGPEQARLSAEDWLNELALRDSLSEPTSYDWRLVTVAALARLVIRMTVTLHYPSSTHLAD